MAMNIFERASRKALRFSTSHGLISTEQLWEMPLSSGDGFNLDDVAKGVHRSLKEADEMSFVSDTPSTETRDDELRMDILKHVIGVKKRQADNRAKRAEKADKRRKLIDALAAKEDAELRDKSKDDILADLAALDDDTDDD